MTGTGSAGVPSGPAGASDSASAMPIGRVRSTASSAGFPRVASICCAAIM